jgi:hypothetical protein
VLSVIKPNVVMLSIIKQSVIMLDVFMLNFDKPSVIMLGVIMLGVVKPSAVKLGISHYAKCRYTECHGTVSWFTKIKLQSTFCV